MKSDMYGVTLGKVQKCRLRVFLGGSEILYKKFMGVADIVQQFYGGRGFCATIDTKQFLQKCIKAPKQSYNTIISTVAHIIFSVLWGSKSSYKNFWGSQILCKNSGQGRWINKPSPQSELLNRPLAKSKWLVSKMQRLTQDRIKIVSINIKSSDFRIFRLQMK